MVDHRGGVGPPRIGPRRSPGRGAVRCEAPGHAPAPCRCTTPPRLRATGIHTPSYVRPCVPRARGGSGPPPRAWQTPPSRPRNDASSAPSVPTKASDCRGSGERSTTPPPQSEGPARTRSDTSGRCIRAPASSARPTLRPRFGATFTARTPVDGLPTWPPYGHRRLTATMNADPSAERSSDRSPSQTGYTCLVGLRRSLAST